MPRLRLSDALPAQLVEAALSGVMLFAANPPIGLWPLAFVALVPFLLTLRHATPMRGALLGLTFGFTYFALLMYWILLFGELGWSGLATANAAYAALFGGLAPVVRRQGRPLVSAFGLAALWTAVEYLRGRWPFGGLTWGDIAYSQADNRFLLPLASILGAWGITFVVVSVNAYLLEAWRARGRWGRGVPIVVACTVAFAPALISIPAPGGHAIDVASIQIHVPKVIAATPQIHNRLIAERHIALHRSLIGDPPDLVVWAEDSLDRDPAQDPELGLLVRQAIDDVGAPTLVGGIMGPPGGRLYNQAVLFDGRGSIVGRYSKQHLVPFGEYVPFRRQLGFLELLRQIRGDLTPGDDNRTLAVDDMTFADVICFENSFPAIPRAMVAQGAGFLVVSTSDASYLTTAASEQHLAMSRLRAVENGRWVVHDAISGVSAFVDPTGGLHDTTQPFMPAVSRQIITTSTRRTLYNRFGDWFALASLIASAGLILAPRPRRAPPRPTEQLPDEARALVILPTYNESRTIGEVIRGLLALDQRLDVLVVDDGSPDGTGDLVEAMDDSRVGLLRRPAKAGLASAYEEGFKRALDGGYDIAVEMDSDLSHDPEQLPRLLEALGSLHMVIGSRYVPGGSVTNWGPIRRALSRAGNAYARLCLGFPFSDTTSGYRAYRIGLLKHLLAAGIHSDGYGFQIELALRAWKDGFAVGEVPITFREREHGHSKISRRIVLEALWQVARWGARERFGGSNPF